MAQTAHKEVTDRNEVIANAHAFGIRDQETAELVQDALNAPNNAKPTLTEDDVTELSRENYATIEELEAEQPDQDDTFAVLDNQERINVQHSIVAQLNLDNKTNFSDDIEQDVADALEKFKKLNKHS
ncbi:MAG: hypothetical protein GY833_22675 [Aestuariibacter sp.]|nr:hypothetical protein [Aestuariibacter sp.]|tara:strand:+ start:231400 stop:231780 length:381 start_codon:yes stop_codon:yes gene_type:complete